MTKTQAEFQDELKRLEDDMGDLLGLAKMAQNPKREMGDRVLPCKHCECF